MATPKCGFCQGLSFRLTPTEPRNSGYKLHAVHCDSCGAVFSFMDYFPVGTWVVAIAKKLGVRV